MPRLIPAAAALLLSALPASAESWGVSDKPADAGDGRSMCMIWYGTSAPMMNITLMSDRNFISVVASPLTAVADDADVRLSYPSGRGGTGKLRKVDQRPDGIFVFFPDAAIDAILGEFVAPGTFTLTSGDVSVSFPSPGLQSAIGPLKSCAAQFRDVQGMK
ncbi:hypothetical protein [Hyphomonas sp.]|uniref:hypothetical protein n=1 Tax=Hyphomonas sp. TaxID=87 RepID=UPI00391C795C